MPTRFPVSVRINDGRVDRQVTATVSKLRWKRTAPGGFNSASMTLNLAPDTFTDLGPADRIWIYGPAGETLWEGFLDNPGSVAGDGGIGLDISAMGTTVLASDQTAALIYADRDLDPWEPYGKNINAATASTSADPTAVVATDGILDQFNRQAIATNAFVQIGYYRVRDAGMQIGSVYVQVKSGKNDAGYKNQIGFSGPGLPPATFLDLNAAISTTLTPEWGRVGATIDDGADNVTLRLVRTGAATNVADDDTWSWFTDVVVIGRRVDRFGTLLSGLGAPGTMQSLTQVRSDWVVEDLVGRMFNGLLDGASAVIDEASFLIDQLAYPDGASAAGVMDDLALYEPDFLWEILEHTGFGYRFNYRAWPTTARYEVSTRDGYDAPGSDFDLCNRIAVKWTDSRGKTRTTVVTTTSAQYPSLKALEDAGRIRDAEPISLSDGRGSAANAQRAGEQALAAKADPPKAATVTVRRPIVDLLRGGTAMPYEIEPGYLVRVRETGDVLRLTDVEVDDEAGVAVLTLGEPVLSDEQRLARLERTTRSL